MLVVAFDTAAPEVGVAIATPEGVWCRVGRSERGVEGLLLPWLQELLAARGLTVREITGVASTHGPGAFTGLRVGLVTAAGLALARGVPLWTTDSLTPRALAAGGTRVLAVLDARKAKVYASRFEDGVCVDGPADEPLAAALARCPTPFVATGEGAAVYAAEVQAAGGTLAREPRHPAVDTLAALAAAALARGEGRPATEVHPMYLREPDAKLPAGKEPTWNEG